MPASTNAEAGKVHHFQPLGWPVADGIRDQRGGGDLVNILRSEEWRPVVARSTRRSCRSYVDSSTPARRETCGYRQRALRRSPLHGPSTYLGRALPPARDLGLPQVSGVSCRAANLASGCVTGHSALAKCPELVPTRDWSLAPILGERTAFGNSRSKYGRGQRCRYYGPTSAQPITWSCRRGGLAIKSTD